MSAPAAAEPPAGGGSRPARIERSPERAAACEHDLIVVGGGILGVALCLEAARGGHATLLVEKDDFGGATSWSSLRILHGGLRYLQHLDLPRFFESVAERSWFLRHFGDLVRPLPCLMPLYGRGLRRPGAFRAALALNDLLSGPFNRRMPEALRPGRGAVLDPAATAARFAGVDREGLRGGALWYDAVMLSSERVIIEMLRWACSCGAQALNHVAAEGLIVEGGAVKGVEAVDRLSGRRLALGSTRVINASGPWLRQLAQRMDRDHAPLFRPTLAFNLLLDRAPPADLALAVEPRQLGARTYFLVPCKGRIFAGTAYAPAPEGACLPAVDERQIGAMLADLNLAVPGLDLRRADVLQVYAGLLPGRQVGTAEPASRSVVHDHGAEGGPRGFYSVGGVKFTTARRLAEAALGRIFGRSLAARLEVAPARPAPALGLGAGAPDDLLAGPDDEVRSRLRALMADESAITLDDLLLRRLDSTTTVGDPAGAAQRIARLLGLDEHAGPSAPAPQVRV